ncbi:OmpA family protein [Pontibacter litorisediminis]|uniref:OmpA family protein n=1 Tax=Pontibacter litorisediminis TaxID=1846260 RepID=UPI0023ED219F|nr:OmpA family protein [Pontibacter litorisediminis]
MKKNMTLMLAGLGILAACNNPEGNVENDTMADATADTAVAYEDERGRVEADGAEIITVDENFWANINWDAPELGDPEMKAAGIEARATNEYNIYTLEDRVLFDTDKAQIRAEGEEKLQKIADKLKSLPANSVIRVFGHADARAGEGYNMELSKERANAVKDWLQNKGNVESRRLSIEAMGEQAPRATNETARGRQLNRRVAIVAVTTQPQQ